MNEDRIAERLEALGRRLDEYKAWHVREHQILAAEVERASVTIDRRLEGMNELRTQITSERGLFVTRDMLDQRVVMVDQRLQQLMNSLDQQFASVNDLTNLHYADNGKRIAELEKARANLDGRMAMIAGLLVLIQVVTGIAAHFWR